MALNSFYKLRTSVFTISSLKFSKCQICISLMVLPHKYLGHWSKYGPFCVHFWIWYEGIYFEHLSGVPNLIFNIPPANLLLSVFHSSVKVQIKNRLESFLTSLFLLQPPSKPLKLTSSSSISWIITIAFNWSSCSHLYFPTIYLTRGQQFCLKYVSLL